MDSDNSNIEEGAIRPEESARRAKIKYSRVKRKLLKHIWFLRGGIILTVILTLGVMSFGTFKLFENLGVGNIFLLGYNFATAPVDQLDRTDGRTNILVMGKAGGSHDGPDLTDTLVLVSVGLTKPDIVTVSIPRDIWLPDIRAKINSAYYWGKQKNVGGISFAKTETEEVVGTPIQYGVVIDFSSFKDIVDALGGIRVDVANSFTDRLYPIAGRENDACGGDPTLACRYMTVSFNSGPQTMNGDTALIFVRSRHAEGIEGTDLAREERQQKVIDAIKNKIMDPKVFLNPRTDLALLNVVKKYVETDIDAPTVAVLARFILRDDKNINQFLIPDNLLVNPPISKTYDQLYVFIPASGNGNWADLNKWFSSVLK